MLKEFRFFLMNPQNGEIYACVNVPEFDLNHPFELNTDADTSGLSAEKEAGSSEPDVEKPLPE